MAKYRKKPVIVDAEVYKRGLEDGFVAYDLSGKLIGYFDKNEPLPKAKLVPAIKTLEGFHQVSEGDYITIASNEGQVNYTGEAKERLSEVFDFSS